MVLGRLAAAEAGGHDLSVAEASFEKAIKEARESKLFWLELRGVWFLKNAVLEPLGRGEEAQRRMEEIGRKRLGGKPLAELLEYM